MKVSKFKVSNSQKENQTHEKTQTTELKEGSFSIFQHPLLQNIKKLKGEKKVSEKSPTMPKK